MSDIDIRMETGEAEALIARVLQQSGTAPDNAASVARALVAAEVDGQAGHGFSRVAAYAAQAKSGKVAGHAVPRIETGAAALLNVDAGNGFAFPAIDAAIDALTALVPATGVAAAFIRRSHHCGQLGAHVERLANHGFVALMMANSPPAMAPWGGAAALFGTNPIAFAAPRREGLPLVIDLSLSKVARGKVMAASKLGKPIPEGWALDSEGRPTTDPDAALKGTMLPAGDAKGAMLALIVEILAGTLTGANHSFEATSFFDAEGAPPGVGQILIAFDPGRTAGPGFPGRLEMLLAAMTDQEGVRLPGSNRALRREAAARDGVRIPAKLHAEIMALAGSLPD
ncbi:Ldh family oxidoreductase [Zhengella sp. ZM62]|uniref:Ldh family oxidoreductase n=1 Tax=Zhengella sedimenti TaxID=3390035 RepID=UPI0039750E07